MKTILKFVFIFFLINFYNLSQAEEYPKNYYEGKFYESVKDNFLVEKNSYFEKFEMLFSKSIK